MNPKFLALLLLPALALPAEDFKGWARKLEARGVTVSAGLWDAASGKALERHQDDRALVPASTTKVVSTYALLKTLKPDFVIETEVWGDLKDGVVQGDLIFKGDWDPMLVNERIWMLGRSLRQVGLSRVTGSIHLDQGAFDGQRAPQGWENTTGDSVPTVLPLSVNWNRDETNRPATDPERLGRETIQKILQESGIPVEGKPGGAGTPAKLLAWSSPPLRAMVSDINKWSNNFAIEMLVRKFGAGSWSLGVKRIQAFYGSYFHLGPETICITDGSGLSKENRLSARTLATILRAAYHDFEVGPEFVDSLRVLGGEARNGKPHGGPRKLPERDANLARRVRMKTGHLDLVTCYCGYLQTLDGQVRVFAILLNGPGQDEDAWEQMSRWAN